MNVCGYTLDQYQIDAVESIDRNTLVLAGAGSGKTLTIIGRIKYLIETKKIKEGEILCLSLTNASVNNLKNKILKYYNYNIKIETFHKLGLEIIQNQHKINIANNYELNYIVEEYLYHIIINEKQILKYILKYLNKTMVINKEKAYQNIIKYNNKKIIKLKEKIIKIINLYKENNSTINKLISLFKKCNKKNKIMIVLVLRIMLLFKEELKATNTIQINDIINVSQQEVDKANFNYKHIIIDEYQDTSASKYQLLKTLSIRSKATIFAVGDDYQSIFAFAGCDLDIFLSFRKCFANSKVLTIPNIYRNSKEITYVAKSFVTKNKQQLNKELHSNKSLYKPIKIIYTNNPKNTIIKTLKAIPTNVLILLRNTKDIDEIISDKVTKGENFIIFNNKKIRVLTVHKSKGLEEDNVILINNKNDLLGFPNKIKDGQLLKQIKRKEKYPYEEERRLFYVALTRTKNNIYLLVSKKHQSCFIKELLKNYRKYIEIIK